jgi:hypothetical protein
MALLRCPDEFEHGNSHMIIQRDTDRMRSKGFASFHSVSLEKCVNYPRYAASSARESLLEEVVMTNFSEENHEKHHLVRIRSFRIRLFVAYVI